MEKNVQGHKRGWSESGSENGELVALCESLEERWRKVFIPTRNSLKAPTKGKSVFYHLPAMFDVAVNSLHCYVTY